MKYKIYVQDNLIDSIDAQNITDVLRIISVKISQQELSYENARDNSIRIEPSDE